MDQDERLTIEDCHAYIKELEEENDRLKHQVKDLKLKIQVIEWERIVAGANVGDE